MHRKSNAKEDSNMRVETTTVTVLLQWTRNLSNKVDIKVASGKEKSKKNKIAEKKE